MNHSPNIRWKQRFGNFSKALAQLEQIKNSASEYKNQDIIQIAMIKAFEFTFELGWKTMKDYLIHNGIPVNLPREVIKQAFANELLPDGPIWIEMIEERNLMVHTYDQIRAQTAAHKIVNNYLPAFKSLEQFFQQKL